MTAMAKLGLTLLIFSSAAFLALTKAQDVDGTLGNETVTNLHFYFHDILSGKNPTAVRVTQASITSQSSTLFGAIMVADDPLTEGPDSNSKVVGRAQGLYTSVSQEEVGLLMVMDYSFTDSPYNGSSISILGRNLALNPVRELPILGGTGMFRFARGFALIRTVQMDPNTGDAVVEYNVTVLHRSGSGSGSTPAFVDGPNIANIQPNKASQEVTVSGVGKWVVWLFVWLLLESEFR